MTIHVCDNFLAPKWLQCKRYMNRSNDQHRGNVCEAHRALHVTSLLLLLIMMNNVFAVLCFVPLRRTVIRIPFSIQNIVRKLLQRGMHLNFLRNKLGIFSLAQYRASAYDIWWDAVKSENAVSTYFSSKQRYWLLTLQSRHDINGFSNQSSWTRRHDWSDGSPQRALTAGTKPQRFPIRRWCLSSLWHKDLYITSPRIWKGVSATL